MGWEQFEQLRQWKDELLRMLRPEGNDATALPRSFLTRLSEIYVLYAANATRQLGLQRQGKIPLEQVQDAIHYEKWQWRLVYQLGRFGERYRHFADSINKFQRDIVGNKDGLIAVLNVLARWTELLTQEAGKNGER